MLLFQRLFHPLVASSLFLTLAGSAGAATLRCEDAFADGSFPLVYLKLDASTLETTYRMGQKNFERALGDGSDFQSRLRDLIAGQPASEAVKAELKVLRKLAIILRSDFVLLDESHEVPPNFENFTKAFGKLNDSLEFDATVLVPDAAKKVLQLADARRLRRDLNSFVAASPKSTEKMVSRVREEILRFANERDLSIEDFHEMRKLLKHLLTFVQSAQSLEPTADKQKAFQILSTLNDSLGQLRQDALMSEVQSRARGEKTSSSSSAHERQELPVPLRDQIREALLRLAIARPAKNGRQALAIETHVRLNATSKRWEVLWPTKKDGFEMLEFSSFADAAVKAREIENPLDLDQIRRDAGDLLPIVRANLAGALGTNFRGRLESRVKESESIKRKLFEKALAKGPKAPWTRITDLVGFRVIVADENAEGVTARLLHKALKKNLVEEHERDLEDGYHAHHLVGLLGTGPRFEIQVMTERMSAWSQWEHDRIYRTSGSDSEGSREKANLIAYSRALARALRLADQGRASEIPSGDRFGISSQDLFPDLPPAASLDPR